MRRSRSSGETSSTRVRWVAQLQAAVAEVQLGVRHGGVRTVHPVDELGADTASIK